MKKILEPIFLNEKMLLNTAAHVFDGYSLKEEQTKSSEKNGKLDAEVGTTLLSKLFSPISLKGEVGGLSA